MKYINILFVVFISTGCFGTFYGAKVSYIDPQGKKITYIERKQDYDFYKAVAIGDYTTVKYMISKTNASKFYLENISNETIFNISDFYHSIANKIQERFNNDISIDRYPLIAVASKYGYIDIVKLLLDYKADPNTWITNDYNKKVFTNAISEAYFHKNYKITALLLKNGANPNVYCIKWKTSVQKELIEKRKNNRLNTIEKELFIFD